MHADNYVIIAGDFNCIYDRNLDNMGGEPHPKIEIDSFNELMSATDMHDVWRIIHGDEKDFTYRRKIQSIARRLDYIFLNQGALECCVSSNIVDVPFTDHRGVLINMINEKVSFGPGYWKMNDSLLKDHAYIYKVNEIIEKTYNENINILNIQTVWEICKKKIQMYSCDYGKYKAHCRRSEENKLKEDLQKSCADLAKSPD